MKGPTIAVLGILVATGPAFAHRAKFEPQPAAARTMEPQREKKLLAADDQDGGPKAPAGAQEPGSAEALRAANELVALISPDLSGQITAQMTAGIWASVENTLKAKVDPATLSELHTEYERLMGKFSSEVFPEIIMKDMPPLYAKYFTAQELQEMLAFNRTNTGTKMRQLSPKLMGEFMSSMVPRMQAFGAELNTSVKAIMERHGYTTGATNQGIASG